MQRPSLLYFTMAQSCESTAAVYRYLLTASFCHVFRLDFLLIVFCFLSLACVCPSIFHSADRHHTGTNCRLANRLYLTRPRCSCRTWWGLNQANLKQSLMPTSQTSVIGPLVFQLTNPMPLRELPQVYHFPCFWSVLQISLFLISIQQEAGIKETIFSLIIKYCLIGLRQSIYI